MAALQTHTLSVLRLERHVIAVARNIVIVGKTFHIYSGVGRIQGKLKPVRCHGASRNIEADNFSEGLPRGEIAEVPLVVCLINQRP